MHRKACDAEEKDWLLQANGNKLFHRVTFRSLVSNGEPFLQNFVFFWFNPTTIVC